MLLTFTSPCGFNFWALFAIDTTGAAVNFLPGTNTLRLDSER
jgi:hypothetical protein